VVDADGMLAAYALAPDGESWTLEPQTVHAPGPLTFLDTAEP
jgi:hypothetical protein